MLKHLKPDQDLTEIIKSLERWRPSIRDYQSGATCVHMIPRRWRDPSQTFRSC